MIRCTGINADLSAIPFSSELERRCGYALGAADLLGQMAAHDYVEKLPTLFHEFEESNRFNGLSEGPTVFKNLEELMQRTPIFWEKYVKPKIERDFGGIHQLLDDPAKNGRNAYIEAIEANMRKLRALLGQSFDPAAAC